MTGLRDRGRGARAGLRWLWRQLRGGSCSPRLGWSVAVGLFVGCQPVYGLHLPLCAAVCLPLRLDLVTAYLAANISNPVLAPALLALEDDIGSLVLTGRHVAFDVEVARATGIAGFAAQGVVGSLLVGGVLAAAGGGLTAALARRFRRPPTALELAMARTLRRYRHAPRSVRSRVAAWLSHDSLPGLLASRAPLGSVLELPSRVGELGLCLLECGAAQRVVGLDPVSRRVLLAQGAACGSAEFGEGNLPPAAWPAVDTILLIDVLHWLPYAEHRPLLAGAARALKPNGRLFLRELDATQWLRCRLVVLLQRLQYRHPPSGGRAACRSAEGWLELLRAVGLDCELLWPEDGGFLAEFVAVGTKAGANASG